MILSLLGSVAGCGTEPRQPAAYFFSVPDASPRVPADTFGRLEYVLTTDDIPMCYGCRIWVSRPDMLSRSFPSASGDRLTTGMIGVLPTGRYEVHVEGPEIVPFVRAVDIYNRKTVRADIHLVGRTVP